jgi:hypothetical protein
MTRDEMAAVMKQMFAEEMATREQGQKEYARAKDNAFSNFEWIAAFMSRGRKEPLTREDVLVVYFLKHLDGIMAWLNGHRSQREDVSGRILDARVYLALLRGMLEDTEETAVMAEVIEEKEIQE